LSEFLTEKQFTLASIGLSDKIAFDWTRSGLYLEEKTSKGRRKYNAIEYVWLRMVKELREFGLPYESLKKLKAFLLQKVDIESLLVEIMEEDHGDQEELKLIQKGLKETYSTKAKLKSAIKETKQELADTVLCLLIHDTVVNKSNAHILIKKDGTAMVSDGEPIDDNITYSDILQGPFISFPLRHILADFLSREDLIDTELASEIVELTPQEEKVLDLLRDGNLVSLTVKFRDKEINLIETEEEINLRDIKGKLVDYIKRNSYQEITYKTEKGKIVSMKRKTKHK
ncbi:MAG: MerR family transcriptional regulator, partial [Crocinitomicaceae bacterium]|nr:MerR family transcriptional regulator [Crocinitomicaceae bacterium]